MVPAWVGCIDGSVQHVPTCQRCPERGVTWFHHWCGGVSLGAVFADSRALDVQSVDPGCDCERAGTSTLDRSPRESIALCRLVAVRGRLAASTPNALGVSSNV